MSTFQKILVANRGEIAVRVMRTARAMGYRTVAVYSTADADAEHVRQADQAVWIGESLPAQSYLDIAAVIEAARTSGADAVHPGYGFLAENAAFAQACRDAGLVFIGPSPEAIRAMGDKAGAKRLMQAAGVPCIPGYQGEDQRADKLAAEAERIGWPVMIKATAGGGGRGMRLVDFGRSSSTNCCSSAQSEALNAFGDATVILERAIVAPRHIEVQVFADRHGHAIHLGERDCSVQRRHQKVIEEAPSPAVSGELARSHGRHGRGGGEGHRVRRRGHAGVPARCRRPVLVHGDEHAAAGGAPGDRGRDRARPGRTAVARGGRRAAAGHAAGRAHALAMRSKCACAPKTRGKASCRRAARSRRGGLRRRCAPSTHCATARPCRRSTTR
jgi:D-alanine-D-alanine ligase-like ATP-grasp enzyme